MNILSSKPIVKADILRVFTQLLNTVPWQSENFLLSSVIVCRSLLPDIVRRDECPCVSKYIHLNVDVTGTDEHYLTMVKLVSSFSFVVSLPFSVSFSLHSYT